MMGKSSKQPHGSMCQTKNASASFGYGGIGNDWNRYEGKRNLRLAAQPIVSQLKGYDAWRQIIEQKGGTYIDLDTINTILSKKFLVNGQSRVWEVSLDNQDSLHHALRDIDSTLFLDIRQRSTFMPMYYLCRSHNDYWCEYRLVVEDLYMSQDFPLVDQRFIRLMHYGHESNFLRLSQMRDKTMHLVGLEDDTPYWILDGYLHSIGRHVFQAAWHDDQNLAAALAKHLGLWKFLQTIELLYLCLSGELCELRSVVDATMIDFFHTVYPQPAIKRFLGQLPNLYGDTITGIPAKAGSLYQQLSLAFKQYLSVEIPWGYRDLRLPLWKVIYGNYSRLKEVAGSIKYQKSHMAAAKALETDSNEIVAKLFEAL